MRPVIHAASAGLLAITGASLVLTADHPDTRLARCALLAPMLALVAELTSRGRRRTR